MSEWSQHVVSFVIGRNNYLLPAHDLCEFVDTSAINVPFVDLPKLLGDPHDRDVRFAKVHHESFDYFIRLGDSICVQQWPSSPLLAFPELIEGVAKKLCLQGLYIEDDFFLFRLDLARLIQKLGVHHA